ncbi:substrate-binding domain-containing protein [bacterium]|nr:substrate-binding domain-containing protein [bacterium]
MKRLFLMLLLAMLCSMSGFGCGKSEKKTETDVKSGKLTIAVIPKGTTHEFWKSIHAGAIKAAGETGAEIIWKGPLKEDDREEQLQIVETFISSKASAIVLAPLDNRSLVMPVREAKMVGIPTIVIDSDLEGDAQVSFIATDNYKGGVLAAERIGELMGGKGKLIMLRYQEGSASTTNREAGFYDTVKAKFPNIEFLSDNQYAGATTESAYRASENLLNRFGTTVEAIFTPNESSTFGCLRALQDRGLTDKIIFVGFDSSEKLVQALEKGEIKGLVLQNPFNMGYLGVKTAVAYLKGEKVEQRIDTGVTIATPDNMNDPEIRQLLTPDLSQYLNQ